jgi:hypothetical protein
MEAYLRHGGLPADAEVREFLENLVLDTLLGEAGASNRALLRAVTLFDVPVPEPVIEVLAGQVGGSAARLRGLGLLDPYPDLYHPARPALAANPLAAGRIQLLRTSEEAALAAVSAGPLFAAWVARHHRMAGIWWPTGSWPSSPCWPVTPPSPRHAPPPPSPTSAMAQPPKRAGLARTRSTCWTGSATPHRSVCCGSLLMPPSPAATARRVRPC